MGKISLQFRLLFVFVLACVSWGSVDVTVITMKGQRFEITATTVGDVQRQIQAKTGLYTAAQAVLFKGRMLAEEDDLQEEGVEEGDYINVVEEFEERNSYDGADGSAHENAEQSMSSFPPIYIPPGPPSMDDIDLRGGLFEMTNKELKEIFDEASAELEKISGVSREEARKQMDEMDDDEAEMIFNNPYILESFRQQVCSQPTVKKILCKIPFVADNIDDSLKWRQSFQEVYRWHTRMQHYETNMNNYNWPRHFKNFNDPRHFQDSSDDEL